MDQFLEKSNRFEIYYVVNNLFQVNICFKKILSNNNLTYVKIKDGTLEDEIVDKRVVIDGRIKFADISSWTIQLLEGLIFIHGESLIHRDLKPA
jgi:serine/threonine protein kinase